MITIMVVVFVGSSAEAKHESTVDLWFNGGDSHEAIADPFSD